MNSNNNLICAQPSKCKWEINTKVKDPHFHKVLEPIPKIHKNVLECIGRTPLIRLNKLPKKYNIKCEILVKCEYFNAGGSVKDRIAIRMIEEAERKGLIKPGFTLIEPTSGNTGIGIALAAVVKGYKCIIVMPKKMSREKEDVLKLLGAKIIRTPTSVASSHPDSHIMVSERLCKSMKDAFILDQYRNEGNPLAHYDGTAEEILAQCDGKLDFFVAGAGTGGTISGISRKLKEKIPSCKIIGVDPVGSILAHKPGEIVEDCFYEVEGIGYDFYPTVFDKNLIDEWVKTVDIDSLKLSRELIIDEGLLCGASSGAAMYAALKVAKNLNENQRIVVILPDGIRNYMTKFVNDEWMIQRNFIDYEKNTKVELFSKPASSLKLKSFENISNKKSIKEAINLMIKFNLSYLPVVNDESENFLGIIEDQQILLGFTDGSLNENDLVEKCLNLDVPKVFETEAIDKISKLFKRYSFVFIIEKNGNVQKLKNIVKPLDLI